MRNKIFAFVAAFIMSAAMMLIPAFADEEVFQNAGELYQSWYTDFEGNGFAYPKEITGVWSTDGGMTNLTFAILTTADKEAVKADILSKIADKETATFVDGMDIPISELYDYQMSLTQYMNEETGFYGAGIREMEGKLVLDVDTSKEGAQDFINMVTSGEYAKYIAIEEVDGAPVFQTETTTADESETEPINASEEQEAEKAPEKTSYWSYWYITLPAAVLLVAVIAMMILIPIMWKGKYVSESQENK